MRRIDERVFLAVFIAQRRALAARPVDAIGRARCADGRRKFASEDDDPRSDVGQDVCSRDVSRFVRSSDVDEDPMLIGRESRPALAVRVETVSRAQERRRDDRAVTVENQGTIRRRDTNIRRQ